MHRGLDSEFRAQRVGEMTNNIGQESAPSICLIKALGAPSADIHDTVEPFSAIQALSIWIESSSR